MTLRVKLTKEHPIPDEVKLARYRKNPELGPKVLFFSGGTALRSLCRELIYYTYNSIHVITTFDSGGSSAKLRQTFDMPAVGDIRARLMALADQTFLGNPEIVELFAHRLPKDASPGELRDLLDGMVKGTDPMVGAIPDPMRKIVRNHLRVFAKSMPKGFDLHGANIGNLVLTAGYLDNMGHLDPVIYIFSRLAEVRGVVRPVLNKPLHLVSVLADGRMLVGQHLISAKEAPPIGSPIKRIFLAEDPAKPIPTEMSARPKTLELIRQAELICYPVGSFYSSILVNFLLKNIPAAISRNPSPKVFVPNTTADPETPGLSVADQVVLLLKYLRLNLPGNTPVDRLLNLVLIDDMPGRYPGGVNAAKIRKLGIDVAAYPLVSDESAPLLDPNRLCSALLSLT